MHNIRQYKTDFQLVSESTGNEAYGNFTFFTCKAMDGCQANHHYHVYLHLSSSSFSLISGILLLSKKILPLEFRIKTPHELFSMIIDYPILIFPSQHSSLIKY